MPQGERTTAVGDAAIDNSILGGTSLGWHAYNEGGGGIGGFVGLGCRAGLGGMGFGVGCAVVYGVRTDLRQPRLSCKGAVAIALMSSTVVHVIRRCATMGINGGRA